MIPMRSWSYLGIEACIISTPQHARPKDNGHIELFRAQLISWSKLVLRLGDDVSHFHVILASARESVQDMFNLVDWSFLLGYYGSSRRLCGFPLVGVKQK